MNYWKMENGAKCVFNKVDIIYIVISRWLALRQKQDKECDMHDSF